MKRLIIVGAGGFGRDLLLWARSLEGNEWRIAGFLDASPDALQNLGVTFPIIGDPAAYQPGADDLFACGLGLPEVKRKVVTDLQHRGARFVTIIHPTAITGTDCDVGEGSVLCPNSVATTNVKLGRFVMLNIAATVGHNATVGDWSTLSNHADVTGHCSIGEGVFFGSHSAVLPSVKVGNNAVLGAGAMVTRDVPADTTVVGVPAKPLPRVL